MTNTDLGLQWKPLSEPAESKRINIEGPSKTVSDTQLNFDYFFKNLHERHEIYIKRHTTWYM